MDTDKILKALIDSNHDYIGVGKAYKLHTNAVRKLEMRSIKKPNPTDPVKKIIKSKRKQVRKSLDSDDDDFVTPIINKIKLETDDNEFIEAIREARTNGINKLTILIKSEVDPVRLVTAINKMDEILKRHSDKESKEEEKDEFFKLT